MSKYSSRLNSYSSELEEAERRFKAPGLPSKFFVNMFSLTSLGMFYILMMIHISHSKYFVASPYLYKYSLNSQDNSENNKLSKTL